MDRQAVPTGIMIVVQSHPEWTPSSSSSPPTLLRSCVGPFVGTFVERKMPSYVVVLSISSHSQSFSTRVFP